MSVKLEKSGRHFFKIVYLDFLFQNEIVQKILIYFKKF